MRSRQFTQMNSIPWSYPHLQCQLFHGMEIEFSRFPIVDGTVWPGLMIIDLRCPGRHCSAAKQSNRIFLPGAPFQRMAEIARGYLFHAEIATRLARRIARTPPNSERMTRPKSPRESHRKKRTVDMTSDLGSACSFIRTASVSMRSLFSSIRRCRRPDPLSERTR